MYIYTYIHTYMGVFISLYVCVFMRLCILCILDKPMIYDAYRNSSFDNNTSFETHLRFDLRFPEDYNESVVC